MVKEDVVEAMLHAALAPQTPTGIFELAGPELMTADAFAEELNRQHVRLTHMAPWLSAVLAHLVPQLTPIMVEVMLHDTVPHDDPTSVARSFGLVLHTIADVWGITAAEQHALQTVES